MKTRRKERETWLKVRITFIFSIYRQKYESRWRYVTSKIIFLFILVLKVVVVSK